MSSNCAFQRTKIFRLNSKVVFSCSLYIVSSGLTLSPLHFICALCRLYVNSDFFWINKKKIQTAEANFRQTFFINVIHFFFFSYHFFHGISIQFSFIFVSPFMLLSTYTNIPCILFFFCAYFFPQKMSAF